MPQPRLPFAPRAAWLAVLALATACTDDPTAPDGLRTPQAPNAPSAAIMVNGALDLDATSATWSEAYAINDAGTVVGWRNVSANPGELYFNQDFLWTEANGMRRLRVDGDWTRGYDINASGQVAGSHAYYGWLWNPTTGAILQIPQPTSSTGTVCNAHAYGLNDAGLVVGMQNNCVSTQGYVYYSASGAFWLIPVAGSVAREVNAGGFVIVNVSNGGYAQIWNAIGQQVAVPQLPTLGGRTEAADINDGMQVVGWSHLPGGNEHAFLYHSTASPQMRDLGTLGGARSAALGINNQGHVVGWAETASGERHAFVWTATDGMRDLGALYGGTSVATGLNDVGDVVGWTSTSNGMRHAVRWKVSVLPPLTTPPAAARVDAGGFHNCAVRATGAGVCWGASFYGQLFIPGGTTGLSSAEAGWFHSCVLRSTGVVQCNNGDGSAQAQVPADLGVAVQIDAGEEYHTCALTTKHTVRCWGGYNLYGENNPPAGLPPVDRVSAGMFNTCVRVVDGTVRCWGRNNDGQSSVPAGLAEVQEIDAGRFHVCALVENDGLRCWGRNVEGQATVPADLGPVQQFSAGAYHTCAVTTAATVRCWGQSSDGRTTVPAALPAARQVSAGYLHTCALLVDGRVTCWGGNQYSQGTTPAGLNLLGPQQQSVVFTSAPPDPALVGGTYTLTANGSAVQPVVFASTTPSVCSVSGNIATLLAAGSCSVHASQPALGDYLASPVATQSFAVTEPYVDPGTTTPGSDVSVKPNDATTGNPSPTTITFDQVTASGTTTVTSGTIGGTGSPVAPSTAQFKLGQPPTYYDVETTASFTGSVTLCFDYSQASYGNESKLRLLHFENGAWVDVTTSVNTQTNIICGTTTTLSPFLVAEQNVAPVIASIQLPSAPVPIGTSVSITVSFSDENANDAHTATIDWEGGTSAGIVTGSAASGTVTATHTYAVPGVYTISVAVSDGGLSTSRSSTQDAPAYIVVFDPSAGFVTGGGWITSPAGACRFAACTNETSGRATFGFVSRYRPGASTPSGETEFQFQAGGLRFRSTSYDWMVPSGARAQFKGVGQINGSGEYGFLITAIDGALLPAGGADRFRIKIWNRVTGAVVYDNQIEQAEDSDAATPLGGGSIVIHR